MRLHGAAERVLLSVNARLAAESEVISCVVTVGVLQRVQLRVGGKLILEVAMAAIGTLQWRLSDRYRRRLRLRIEVLLIVTNRVVANDIIDDLGSLVLTLIRPVGRRFRPPPIKDFIVTAIVFSAIR